MFNVVLYEPEIPSNTGNIGRTCVVTGSRLHLVEPLGFSLEDDMLRRAGLGYWHSLDVRTYASWEVFLAQNGLRQDDARLHLLTKKAKRTYTEATFSSLARSRRGFPRSSSRTCPSAASASRCFPTPRASRTQTPGPNAAVRVRTTGRFAKTSAATSWIQMTTASVPSTCQTPQPSCCTRPCARRALRVCSKDSTRSRV